MEIDNQFVLWILIAVFMLNLLLFAGITPKLIFMNPLGLNLPCYEFTGEDNVLVSRVYVDQSIIQGYEGENYIPRSASINERLGN